MSIIELGALGELIAAVAVLITLIYLTLQLRQNTSIVRANAFQAWVAAENNPLNAVQQNDSVMKAVVDGLTGSNELTEYNWIQYGAWLQQMMLTVQATYYMHAAGAIPLDVYEAELDRALEIINLEYGKQWWEACARSQFSSDFVAVIESRKQSSVYRSWGFTPGVGFHSLEPSNEATSQ